MEFVELDARIEELSGLSLAEVFAIHGASYYREVEHDALTALLEETDCAVVATGGSLVTHTETWALLRRRMRTVWLQAEAQELWDRVIAQGDHRPMEQNPQAFAQLQELLELRMPLYQQAQYRVSTSDRAVQSVVSEVVRSLSLAGNSEGRSADR
jgi:shikimate kinase